MFTKAFFKNVLIFTLIVGVGVGILYWYNHRQTLGSLDDQDQEVSTLQTIFEN